METLAEFKDFIEKGHLEYRPNTTVDCVIFGYQAGELKVLLLRNTLQIKWCLPGGYIRKDETLEEAASRITKNRTGIGNLFLHQFKAFGDPDRNLTQSIDEDKLSEFVDMAINPGLAERPNHYHWLLCHHRHSKSAAGSGYFFK